MKKPNYSLWLMPPLHIHRRLKQIILRLSRGLCSPAFEPHVTLLGRLNGTETELVSNTRLLASRLNPIVIQFEQVDYLKEYFRCLFIRVAWSSELLDAYRTAVEVFGTDPQSEFMPHLSLVYADLKEEAKIKVIRDTGTSFQDCFQVQNIHLYSTSGSPENWYRVCQFALGKNHLLDVSNDLNRFG